MTDEGPTEAQPVSVTVIATGSDPGSPLHTGTVATTPGRFQPNLIVTVVSPLMAILIRFMNAYLTILVGLVAAGMTSDIIPATDFLHLVLRCGQLSFAGAGIGLLKDIVTIVGKLESKFPLSTGSV